MTNKELEEAYKLCHQGTIKPTLMIIKCEVCRKSFVLTAEGPNEVCPHLMLKLIK